MNTSLFYFVILINCFPLINSTQSPENSQNFTPCQCYCSDVCGPQQSRPSDRPFVDEQTGICFCQPRDKANYLKNDCHLKNPNPSIQNSCCQIEAESEEADY